VERMSTHIPPELIDELMDVYVEWREECVALRETYERWADEPVSERKLAFAAYLAALEREEHASAVYADRLHEIEREPHEPITPPSTLGEGVISRVSGLLGSADQSRAG
jgi:hypothetical protein